MISRESYNKMEESLAIKGYCIPEDVFNNNSSEESKKQKDAKKQRLAKANEAAKRNKVEFESKLQAESEVTDKSIDNILKWIGSC